MESHEFHRVVRIGAQKTAKTIGIGIGTLFVTFVMAAIVRGDPDDRDSLAEDLLRDLGGTAIEEAGFIATMAMADSESEDMARIERSCIGRTEHKRRSTFQLYGNSSVKLARPEKCADRQHTGRDTKLRHI